ncbi:MAG: hypothetical protein HC877_04745 [Thioploca sp.]|nr:hypothetical protein [Thioploca sp.]
MLTLSHYQLIEPLYIGTHTTVYRAHRQTDNAPVILKLLKSDYPTPEAGRLG